MTRLFRGTDRVMIWEGGIRQDDMIRYCIGHECLRSAGYTFSRVHVYIRTIFLNIHYILLLHFLYSLAGVEATIESMSYHGSCCHWDVAIGAELAVESHKRSGSAIFLETPESCPIERQSQPLRFMDMASRLASEIGSSM